MFISENFIFNGISNINKEVCLVTFDSGVLQNVGVAFNRTISAKDGYTHLNPGYNVADSEVEDVILNLAYVNENDVPLDWTEDKIVDIKKWLITDDFAQFISEDNPNYVYYLMCSHIEKKMTPYMVGVLEVTFKVFSHFVYEKLSRKVTVNGSSTINITNPSMYVYNPIMKIKNKGNSSTVNKVGIFEITGLNTNEEVVVDNLMLTVINTNSQNRFSNCNRSWVELTQGNNSIVVEGNCEVEILCEFPILM